MKHIIRLLFVAAVGVSLGFTVLNVSKLLSMTSSTYQVVSEEVIPDTITQRTFMDLSFPYRHTETEIRMNDTIKTVDTAKTIGRILQDAHPGDRVVFHLSGYGGSVDTVLYIINNIQITKALVIMSVEGPVYSGHAYLSLSGHVLQMTKYSFIMLHTSTVVDLNCETVGGLDRGHPASDKCSQYKKANVDLINKVISNLPYLTTVEKAAIIEGNDVYLTPEDIDSRAELNA
jgi:membrane-bound ClpP family serine protease